MALCARHCRSYLAKNQSGFTDVSVGHNRQGHMISSSNTFGGRRFVFGFFWTINQREKKCHFHKIFARFYGVLPRRFSDQRRCESFTLQTIFNQVMWFGQRRAGCKPIADWFGLETPSLPLASGF